MHGTYVNAGDAGLDLFDYVASGRHGCGRGRYVGLDLFV